ncbi:zinc-binding dehydrogenase [Sorangium sp. So ce131]
MVDNAWGITRYPFVPGHEIAGTVAAVGSSVDPARLRVGQRVAFGGLGATRFIATEGTGELKKAAQSFDFILSTVSADLPWDDYLATLRPQGKLCIVGVPEKPIALNAFALLTSEKVVAGGIPGSIVETTQMLAFTARHAIKPTVELFPMSEANKALDHTRQGKARFRAVLAA